MVEALVDAVVDGAVGEQARETTLARVEQALGALDVEERVLLPGEAGRRKVLGRRRAPDSETHILAVLLLKLFVGAHDLRGQVVGNPCAIDDLTRALAFAGQRGDVIGVDAVELLVQGLPGAGLVQHVPICLCSDREPVRDTDTLVGELLIHLAKRGVLSANDRHILDADLVEKADVRRPVHDLISTFCVSGGQREW